MRKERKFFKLHEAVIENNKELVLSCISEGLDVNEKDENSYTPLHYAAQESFLDIAQILIDAGAEIDSKDEFGNTPLSNAIFGFGYKQDPAMIKLLLAHGANKYEKNNSGVSPYSLAESIATFPVLQYLK